MKTKLIKLSKIHYIVVDDSEIKDCYYYNSLDKVIRFGNNLNHPYHYKITHSTEPLEGIGKLSLKNCQAIERGYDLDELLDNVGERYNHSLYQFAKDRFKEGFQKALEILGDKKFTTEQVFSFLNNEDNYTEGELGNSCIDVNTLIYYFKFLLPKTEWDVIVEMECVIGCQNLILNGENSVCCGDKKPKISEDGCLILKRT